MASLRFQHRDADINCYYIINLQLRGQQILGYIMFLTNPSYYGQSKDPYIDRWITPSSFILWCTDSGICCRCRCLCLNGTRWYPISDALGCMHVTLITNKLLAHRDIIIWKATDFHMPNSTQALLIL